MFNNVIPDKKGTVIAIIGLAGSGKTTLAKGLFKKIHEYSDRQVVLLDSDDMRKFFIKNKLGHSIQDRWRALERSSFTISILEKMGAVTILTGIFPKKEHRDYLREHARNLIYIYLNTPLDICRKRHPSQLYSKAKNSKTSNVIGVNVHFEIPDVNEVHFTMSTENKTIQACVDAAFNFLYQSNLMC